MASARRNDFVRSSRKKAGSDGAEATGTGIFHSFSAEMREVDADANTVPRALCPVTMPPPAGVPVPVSMLPMSPPLPLSPEPKPTPCVRRPFRRPPCRSRCRRVDGAPGVQFIFINWSNV